LLRVDRAILLASVGFAMEAADQAAKPRPTRSACSAATIPTWWRRRNT
jgi:hypothetical protein